MLYRSICRVLISLSEVIELTGGYTKVYDAC